MNEVNEKKPKVSIIMPAYNAERFIGFSIESILNQTFSDWELIIIDDFSTDETEKIVKNYKDKTKKIIYYKLNSNSGAAKARNKGIEMAKGKYIAFLDSDDYWYKNKLKTQINFMDNNNYTFSCTGYEKIDEFGEKLNKVITPEKNIDYNELLKNCPGNSTVVYNADILGKFFVPNIKKRNDYLMWLNVIKKANILYGIQETLGTHRVMKGTISSNKFSLIKYHWKVYRNFEKLSLSKTIYLTYYWIFKTIRNRLRA